MGLAGSFRTIQGKEIHSVLKETAASWCEEDGWFMESIPVLWEARQDNVHSVYAPVFNSLSLGTTDGDHGIFVYCPELWRCLFTGSTFALDPKASLCPFGMANHGSSGHTPGLSS